ncbi:PREDICTED: uncharacterized protein LOC104759545 [Camelina sativa]|uniref:Uncharacterized protein LOC104759545 n=1 Tax=Camelina sativa TaxID=90675 RepID=A0ABM0X4Y1_CAMSA|nr:PREDICTED: uncharacterized protein LOC104759545 [Camelina sativa]
MADPNQSVPTCILKVDLKCCTSCQNKASIKLKSISGVEEVAYNSEKGLLTVTGDVEPMALVRKLNKCGKETELFSVKYPIEDDDLQSDDEDETSSSDSASSYYDPKPMEREFQEKMNQQEKKKKTLLQKIRSFLCCFTSKSKLVQPLPMRNRNWQVPSKFQLRPPQPRQPYPPTMRPHHLPMMQQQQLQMMQQQQLQMMQQQPGYMFQQAYQPHLMPNQGQHYLLPNPAQPMKINRSLHFPPTKDGNVRLL